MLSWAVGLQQLCFSPSASSSDKLPSRYLDSQGEFVDEQIHDRMQSDQFRTRYEWNEQTIAKYDDIGALLSTLTPNASWTGSCAKDCFKKTCTIKDGHISQNGAYYLKNLIQAMRYNMSFYEIADGYPALFCSGKVPDPADSDSTYASCRLSMELSVITHSRLLFAPEDIKPLCFSSSGLISSPWATRCLGTSYPIIWISGWNRPFERLSRVSNNLLDSIETIG